MLNYRSKKGSESSDSARLKECSCGEDTKARVHARIAEHIHTIICNNKKAEDDRRRFNFDSVTQNSDTLYSANWLKIPKRFYLVNKQELHLKFSLASGKRQGMDHSLCIVHRCIYGYLTRWVR